MTLNYVTLTLDLYDGQGNYPVSGTASFTPSAVLTDAGVEIIGQQPVICSFRPGGVPSVSLLATDNSGPAPAGWTWSITFSGVTGAPSAFSFFLPFTGGASQLLSNLIPVSSGTSFQAYMPLPTGTPSSGQVPVATGSGEASAWGSVATNPMTTSGDTVYGGAAGALTRLPGDTSNTRKFLREQSSAGTAQPPAWDTLQSGDIPANAANTSGTAAGLSATLAIGSGGTGQTSAAAAYNALSPMTTTGDIEYESGTGTAARLAGSTSATKAVLTQTGTGSTSAAPAWSLGNAASSVPLLDSAQRYVTPLGSFLLPSPPPVSRRPAWRPASFAQIFQAGHGWTATGAGVGSSNLNDTSAFIKGTQCATVVTAGNGSQASIRSTAVASQDLTGKCVRLTFQVADVTHLNTIQLFVGSSAFANNFNWTAHTHSASAQNIVQSGEWVTLTVPWANVQTASGTYSISASGVPSVTSGFTCFQVTVTDDAAGAVTFHLQSVEVIPDTPATFPGGVVSAVFDDSYQTVYDNARPVMDTYGYRGTLYTIASSVGVFGSLTLTEMKNLQVISGWEIGGHAYTLAAHNAGYDTLTALQVEDEMRYLRSWMLSNGFPLDSFAYPQGHFSSTTDNVPIDQICGQYFSTGRSIISETAETFAPAMPFRLRSKTGISSSGTAVSVITAAGGPLDRCQLDGSWYIISLHDVTTGSVTTSTQISSTDFSTLMAAISSRNIPVLPVGDVIRNYT